MAHLVPRGVAERLGFRGVSNAIKEFMNVSLYEIIKTNTKTTFLTNCTKYCYRLNYKDLSLSVAEARDNYGDAVLPRFKDAYVKQLIHSISGEQNDLCLYTYSPTELKQFLQQNSHLHYVYLPITVNATDSANGYRHDMLLIFDNRTKKFHWFDGRNREDYLPLGAHLPKNAMDVLFINLDNHVQCGYEYVPSQAWQITGTLHSYGSIGLLDFILSTAWCYNAMLMLDHYETPIEYISVLDTMDEVDRFMFLMNSMSNLLSSELYHNLVPQNAQVNLTAQRIPVALPELKQNSQVIPVVAPIIAPAIAPVMTEPKSDNVDRYSTVRPLPTPQVERTYEDRSSTELSSNIIPNATHSSSREPSRVDPANHADVQLTHRVQPVRANQAAPETAAWKPMPVVSSNTLAAQQRNENCSVQ